MLLIFKGATHLSDEVLWPDALHVSLFEWGTLVVQTLQMVLLVLLAPDLPELPPCLTPFIIFTLQPDKHELVTPLISSYKCKSLRFNHTNCTIPTPFTSLKYRFHTSWARWGSQLGVTSSTRQQCLRTSHRISSGWPAAQSPQMFHPACCLVGT